jgi:hypothetical protein
MKCRCESSRCKGCDERPCPNAADERFRVDHIGAACTECVSAMCSSGGDEFVHLVKEAELARFEAHLEHAERLVGRRGFFDAVRSLSEMASDPALARALDTHPILRHRWESVFAATDAEGSGITPIQDEVRALIEETEDMLARHEYGDDLLLNIGALRSVEEALGLPAILTSYGGWYSRYDCVLQEWKELRHAWQEGDATYTPPPVSATATGTLIDRIASCRRKLNESPADQGAGATYDAAVAELLRRGVNVTQAERA